MQQALHYVTKNSYKIANEKSLGLSKSVFATGCFWGIVLQFHSFLSNHDAITSLGAEKGFWRLPGVYSTAVGYIGGSEKYSFQGVSYEQVCSQKTGIYVFVFLSNRSYLPPPGHTEAVLVYFDPLKISMADLLVQFWMCHNPTQVNGQGHDHGTQYRYSLLPHLILSIKPHLNRTGIYVYDDEHLALAKASKDVYEKVYFSYTNFFRNWISKLFIQ